MHQSIPTAPSPSSPPPPTPPRYCGAFAFLVSPGGRAFAKAVSYQNTTTQMILLEKQAYWLNCQGQEKIEEGCKD